MGDTSSLPKHIVLSQQSNILTQKIQKYKPAKVFEWMSGGCQEAVRRLSGGCRVAVGQKSSQF